MLMELHDNRPVSEIDPATAMMIANALQFDNKKTEDEEQEKPTKLGGTFQQSIRMALELSNNPGFGWIKDVLDPKAAEKERFEKLLNRTIRNNWAQIRDPRTLKIIQPETGIKQLDNLNCLQLRVLEHNFVNHYLPYYGNGANYRKGTKKRVINRYFGVYSALLATVQNRIQQKQCPTISAAILQNSPAVNSAPPFTITPGTMPAGNMVTVMLNGQPVQIRLDQPSPLLPGMPNPNANPVIPLGLLALALNL